jgi:hypothetical protein
MADPDRTAASSSTTVPSKQENFWAKTPAENKLVFVFGGIDRY